MKSSYWKNPNCLGKYRPPFSSGQPNNEADRLHLFLLSDGIRIYFNEYLESLENGTELIVCKEEQIKKLSIYFQLKSYLSLKNISYPLNIDYFIWGLAAFWAVAFFTKNNFDVKSKQF